MNYFKNNLNLSIIPAILKQEFHKINLSRIQLWIPQQLLQSLCSPFHFQIGVSRSRQGGNTDGPHKYYHSMQNIVTYNLYSY